MRYAEEELSRLKASSSILDIFQEKGFSLVKRGKHYATLCPFHADKNPSLIITPENNLWNCLGCSSHGNGKTGGNVFEFLMKHDQLTFIGAVEYLKKRSGHGNGNGNGTSFSSLVEKNFAATEATSARGAVPASGWGSAFGGKTIKPSINVQKILQKVVEFYHRTFSEDKKGHEYLKARGIHDPKLFEQFRIGFSNGTIFKTIPEKGEVVEELKQIGILSENGHELFRDCVVFPILDRNGNIIHLYGRKITSEAVKHLYLSGSHRGLFNRHILKSYDEIILTESIIDSLSLYQADFKNTIPCYGINGFTEEHLEAFKENNIKSIIILFDSDESGKKAARDIKERLEGLGYLARIVELPSTSDGRRATSDSKEDPNSFLLKHSPEELEKLVYPSSRSTGNPDVKSGPSREQVTGDRKPIADGFVVEHNQRKYLIRGIEGSPNRLKANIRAESFRKFHIDTVDLYNAKARAQFIKDAAVLFKEEQEVIGEDMQRIILAVEEHIAAKKEDQDRPLVMMSDEERRQAISFGKQSNLIEAILKDISLCGFIGEDMNKLVAYLAMSSRKMENPLSILIISGSGAGKTSLQDAVLSLCPEEDLIKLTSLTGKALFYKKELSLTHKVLAVEEEKGAEEADYAIRNLITAKELVIEATIKDVYTGKLTTMTNTVKCNTAVFKTTTNPETNPETKTRFIILSVDESRPQTQKILDYQREVETPQGYLKRIERDPIITKHRNFQRLLKSITVLNPYAKLLTYLDDRMSVRRDHPKYLQIIKAVAFIHQMQRPIKMLSNGQEYMEATLEDIALGNQIAHTILGHSLDELSRPSQKLLELAWEMVQRRMKEENRSQNQIHFSRREIREYTRWSEYQLRTHIKQLVDLEYLLPISGRHGQQFKYELLYQGEAQEKPKFMLGLKNIETLREEARKVGLYE